MKVKVRDGFQINHQGKLHTGGDTVDVPDAQAQRWVTAGLVKAVSGSKNKAVQSSANKALEVSMSNTKAELLAAAEGLDVDESNTKAEILEALEG